MKDCDHSDNAKTWNGCRACDSGLPDPKATVEKMAGMFKGGPDSVEWLREHRTMSEHDWTAIGSMPELMRAVLASVAVGADEWDATHMTTAWLRAHPEFLRALLEQTER